MSVFTKFFIAIAAALFGVPGLKFAFQGEWKTAAACFFFTALILFIGSTGWFHYKFPTPKVPPGAPRDIWSEIKRFHAAYPGWPGRVVKYGLPTLLLLNIIPRAVSLLRSMNVF